MSTILITGSSQGIGFETALAFARAGHRVLATMRNPTAAPALAATAAKEGLAIEVSALDVISEPSVSSAFAALSAGGAIDVLVNNAGVESIGSVEETALDEFRHVMETNYFGMLRCTKALLPQMRARGSGCIVNMSSVSGQIACPPMAAYSASKWAMEAATEALAAEMKVFGVRVAIVEPGIIDTAMARRMAVRGDPSAYIQSARFNALFSGSLQKPVPASIVAAKVLEVVESGTWTLRHPVGPDALPLIAWRRQKTDEEWIELNGGDDATFFGSLGM